MDDLSLKRTIDFPVRFKMFNRKEVADLHNVHVDTVTMWMEIGVIKAIKTGKCYMFSQEEISRFQRDYRGLDVSNRVKAIESYNKVNDVNNHIGHTFLTSLGELNEE